MTDRNSTHDESWLQHQRNCWKSNRPIRLGTPSGDSLVRDLNPEQLLDCIYNEVLLRRSAGETPNLEEYLSLYPQLREDLQSLFDVDQALGDKILHHTIEKKTRAAQSALTLVQAPPHSADPDISTEGTDGLNYELHVRTSSGQALPVTEVLRKRLLIAAVVLALNYAQAYPQMRALFDASILQVWIQIPLSFCFAGISVALWRQPSGTMRWLRWIELIVFWLPITQLSVFLIERHWWKGELVRAMMSADGRLGDLLNTMILCYFPMVVSYGVLIPNKLLRCVWVTCVMACVPVTILLVGIPFYDEAWKEHWGLFVRGLAWVQSWMMIAVVIASFGSYRIQELVRQVAEARQMGSYRLKQRIGSGGMGEVYLAEHKLLKQPCAVKLIRSDRIRDPLAIRRFEREVQTTASLRHPNTIEIFDYGVAEDGTFYYAMEYLDGKTVERTVMDSGPMPIARGLHVLLEICGPLKEAHGIGLVHRDLKPANVIIYNRGGIPDSVKLLDFGLVKDLRLVDQEASLTKQNVVAGTPAYMSPEQIADAKQLDPRSDIYSLGSLAYYVFCGRPMFQGNAMQILADQLHVSPPSLKSIINEFPVELSDVVDRCLAKVPEDRFTSIEALSAELSRIALSYPWSEADALACDS